ncbi:MAG: hypothetical protein K0M69_08180 [Youngiibacter sp.]|nr:hypothetical protein [Youngiibacter sp.]
MTNKIIVVAHSIMNQSSLPEDKRLSNGALPLVSDLVSLGLNIVQIPDVEKFYSLYVKRSSEDKETTPESFESYTKRTLVPYVEQVMEKVKSGDEFVGVLTYRGDETQRMEPETSPVMLELFRLFDRNCMATPYYEIGENLEPQEMDLSISDIIETLGI